MPDYTRRKIRHTHCQRDDPCMDDSSAWAWCCTTDHVEHDKAYRKLPRDCTCMACSRMVQVTRPCHVRLGSGRQCRVAPLSSRACVVHAQAALQHVAHAQDLRQLAVRAAQPRQRALEEHLIRQSTTCFRPPCCASSPAGLLAHWLGAKLSSCRAQCRRRLVDCIAARSALLA